MTKAAAGNKDDVLLKKLFKEFDITKDGFLSFHEFESMMKKLNVEYNKKYLSAIFNKIDVNRSGFIEFHEFHYFICHNPY